MVCLSNQLIEASNLIPTMVKEYSLDSSLYKDKYEENTEEPEIKKEKKTLEGFEGKILEGLNDGSITNKEMEKFIENGTFTKKNLENIIEYIDKFKDNLK